jgi:hypothetical protein
VGTVASEAVDGAANLTAAVLAQEGADADAVLLLGGCELCWLGS